MDSTNPEENYEDEFIYNGNKGLFGLTDVYTSFSYVIILFLIFAIGGCVQVTLVLYGVVDSNLMKDDVITPINSIFNEYSPNSAMPCYYRAYTHQYNETKPCSGKIESFLYSLYSFL